MHQGDTFTVRSIDDHLWVILSHPDKHPEEIVCVSVTSRTQYADHACLLAVGDHPFIKHDSYVYYEKPTIVSCSWIETT